jgi:hypothetical protein
MWKKYPFTVTNPQLADTDGDRVSDGEELTYWGANWNSSLDEGGTNKLLDSDSDGDGQTDGWEISNGYNPSDPLDNGITVCENAEHETTRGWDIYDNTPTGAVSFKSADQRRQMDTA